MGSLHKFMFGYLPDYFKINDTYKDVNDRGFLERFLLAFEEELEDTKTLATGVMDLRDALITPTDILQYINDGLMNPVGRNEEQYIRKLLSLIWNLNKLKGTKEGLIKYFRVLGIDAVITLTPLYGNKYDDSNDYGDGAYDTNCNTCTHDAVVGLKWSDGSYPFPLDSLGASKLNDIVEHLMPINITWSIRPNPNIVIQLAQGQGTFGFSSSIPFTVVQSDGSSVTYSGTTSHIPCLTGSRVDVIFNIVDPATNISFNASVFTENATSIAGVELYDVGLLATMKELFKGLTAMTYVALIADLSNITDYTRTFANCVGLTSLPAIALSEAITVEGMLQGASHLVCIAGQLDTTTVTVKTDMFQGATSLLQPSAENQVALVSAAGTVWTNANSCP